MANKTVWNKGAGWLALLAVVSFAAPAREVDFSMPDDDPRVVQNVDPADYGNLDGAWRCHFLKAKGEIEQNYYSIFIFESTKHLLAMLWSPVHKGDAFYYRWDGKQLVLGFPADFSRQIFGTYKTQIQVNHALVIEMPGLRWKGWLCHRQPTEQWPPDGLQFLDYSRYPWLSGLIEDGPSIMKYRNPKQYEEWLKGYPKLYEEWLKDHRR